MSALRRLRDDAGQALVILALAMSGTMVAAGVGLDAGLQFVEHRREQAATDAAAFAAAVELAKNWSSPSRATIATNAARAYALSNGYDNATGNTVTVNIPPASGPYAGNADYAEVIVTTNVQTAFMRILGSSFQTRQVQARAVGGITGPAKTYSIIALSKTAAPGFQVTGNAEVEAENAGILVNSTAGGAFTANGNAEIEAEIGGIDVAGTASLTGGVEIKGTLRTGQAQQLDPLAYLQPPSTVGLPTFGNITVTTGEVFLDPGIYASISASGTGRIKLRPGIYIIRGGGMSATGQGRIEDETSHDGQGVLVFNACSAYPSSGGTCGAITVAGNGRIELEKTLSGPYAGISIWQPCENTSTLSVDGSGVHPRHGQSGSDDEEGELETDGSIYVPCGDISATGKGEIEIENGQLIGRTISAVGNAEIEVEWSSVASTSARMPMLVE